MKKLAIALALAALMPAARAADMTEEQKTLYALGAVLGNQIHSSFAATPAELEFIKKGLTDVAAGNKPAIDMEIYGPKIQELAQARGAARAEKTKAEGKTFADKAAQEKGAVKSASGLIYIPVKEGSGKSPAATDIVKVHYRGTLTSGQEFDSSYARNEPAQFPLNGVIKCWTEGVARMKVGGKARLVCPSAIAYGDQGTPGGPIPPGATLAFEVELLDIVKPAAAPKAAAPKK
ncbi:MAG: FKBP-type peptidyl-prolyl cis-trans isomerase [Candidatus Dactylopiibacterium sp.]|nr:FKBP-type peptidyl-prolyl cis-trans isomerase [Candidatus Dactylopiibacterium sp.]